MKEFHLLWTLLVLLIFITSSKCFLEKEDFPLNTTALGEDPDIGRDYYILSVCLPCWEASKKSQLTHSWYIMCITHYLHSSYLEWMNVYWVSSLLVLSMKWWGMPSGRTGDKHVQSIRSGDKRVQSIKTGNNRVQNIRTGDKCVQSMGTRDNCVQSIRTGDMCVESIRFLFTIVPY